MIGRIKSKVRSLAVVHEKEDPLALQIAKTDNTFSRVHLRGQEAWVGKCLHCGAKVVVTVAGKLLPPATIEHILPKHHGGDDSLPNVGIACRKCNNEKGVHLDRLPKTHPRLVAMIQHLSEVRQKRWREPGD